MDTITVSDIDAEHGVEVELTETEKLVTKMNIRWRLGYSLSRELQAEPNNGPAAQHDPLWAPRAEL